jgi:alkaline phosphatase D
MAEERNSLRVSELVAKLNYGLASFDWVKDELLIEIKGENGSVYAKQMIQLSKNK